MRITLKQLAVFEAVAMSGQVSKAAEAINLSSPATSMALSELEKQLNTRLFERIGNKLRLNSQGVLLLPLATEALQKVTQIENAFSSLGTQLNGTLSVSASSTIGNFLLAKSAVAFCQQYTNTRVNVNINNTQSVINDVLDFKSEIGFIEGPCLDSRVIVEAWHKDHLVVFCHPAHPLAGQHVSPKELNHLPWVMREEGSGTRECFIHAANTLDMNINEKFCFSTPDAIKQAVKQGAGLGVLSKLTVEKAISRKELAIIHIDNLLLERNFYRIVHKSRQLSPVGRTFIDFCQDFLSLKSHSL